MFRKTQKKIEYLSEQDLINLKEHKYSCNGRSIIEPLFQVFWNWLIEYVPSNIAPNTLTLVGLLANVASVVLLATQFAGGVESITFWALLFCSFGLFFYQTLDALDGKQARKTNTSSQLGELFDHGCDAISSNFVVIGNIMAIGMSDYPWLMFIHFFMTTVAFYMAHWQVYVTGTLEFGKLDVTESQLAVILVYIVSAAFGIEFWSTNMPYLNVEWKIFHFFVMLFGGVNFCFRYGKIILRGGSGRHGATIANTSILFPVFSIALVVLMAVTVAVKSPTQIYHQHPVLFLISFGMVACKVTQKLVVAHMTKSELTLFDYEFIGPTMLVLNQYWFNSYFNEYRILWLCLTWTTLNMLWYARSVCMQVADSLNIYIFSVCKRPPLRGAGDHGNNSANSILKSDSGLRTPSHNFNNRTVTSGHSSSSNEGSVASSTVSHHRKPFKIVESDKLNWKTKQSRK